MAERIGQDIIDLLTVPSTATLTSVMRQLSITNTFMHRVVPLRPDMRMAGPAFTLRYIPARQDLDPGTIDNLQDAYSVLVSKRLAKGKFW